MTAAVNVSTGRRRFRASVISSVSLYFLATAQSAVWLPPIALAMFIAPKHPLSRSSIAWRSVLSGTSSVMVMVILL